MNKRLLLISQSGSYRIAAFLHAAKSININVLVATPGEHSLITEIQDGLQIDLNDFTLSLERIYQEHQIHPFTGIVGTDDSTVELATHAAQTLGLIHNPPYSAKLTQRKDLARACLAENQCAVPEFRLIDLSQILSQALQQQVQDIRWPCVLKPLAMSASRGVIRVNSMAEFITACARIGSITSKADVPFERTHLLLEKYIDGMEVAFEGYLENGELQQLALFDKPNPLVGPYFEETIYVTPSRLNTSIQELIKQCVLEACKAYGLVTGPIHAELRIDKNNKPWILEVANRSIGGDCGRTLDGSEKYFIEKLIIALATGKAVPCQKIDNARGVMMIPIHKAGILHKITGVEEAKKIPDITGITININPGNELIPLPEGNQYLGYIFAASSSPERVIAALNKAYSSLAFKLSPKINLQQI